MDKRADTNAAEKQSMVASLRRWAVVWLLVGLVLLSIPVYFYMASVVFKKTAYSTQGKVVHMAYADILINDIDWIAGRINGAGRKRSNEAIRKRAAHYPIVEFTDHLGSMHRLQSTTTRRGDSYPNTVRVEIKRFGRTFNVLPSQPLVTILFNPNNPQDFMIDDGQPWFVIVFMVSGIALVLFALICFISVWQVKNRIRKNNS